MIAAFGIAFIYTTLHWLRNRWWLWTMALFSFIIAYFTLFNLEFILKLDVFIGYQTLGISILFLLPDLSGKKTGRQTRVAWLPPRLFGALFVLYTSITYSPKTKPTMWLVVLRFTRYSFGPK